MERVNRTRCVLLGLLCLMPSLFFWALKSLPVDNNLRTTLLFFSDATQLEFVICGFIFPVLAVGLGWKAYTRCENKSLSLVVVAVGLLEIIGVLIAAMSGLAL